LARLPAQLSARQHRFEPFSAYILRPVPSRNRRFAAAGFKGWRPYLRLIFASLV
jgi:hypothetical protein